MYKASQRVTTNSNMCLVTRQSQDMQTAASQESLLLLPEQVSIQTFVRRALPQHTQLVWAVLRKSHAPSPFLSGMNGACGNSQVLMHSYCKGASAIDEVSLRAKASRSVTQLTQADSEHIPKKSCTATTKTKSILISDMT